MSTLQQTASIDSSLTTDQVKHLEKAQTLTQIIFNQFKEHKAAVVGSYIILAFVLIAVCAPLIEMATGLDSESQNVFNRYKPPFSRVQAGTDVRENAIQKFIEKNPDEALKIQTQLLSKNIVSPAKPEDALFDWATLTKDKAMTALDQIDTSKKSELNRIANKFESFHVMGTDELGRDVMMRLIYGTRISMGVGILVALASSLIGLLIGAIAGFYGGAIDTLLMRVTDALLSLPLLPVLIVVSAIDLQKIPALKALLSSGNESLLKLVFILCIFSWMTVARLVRGSILSLREREFILASKTLGATDFTIISRHMFPNVLAPILVSVTLGVGDSILFEAALSYLGLGIQPPTPSWGNMLFNAQELIYEAPFLAIIPGVLIFLVVVSFNFLGDGLQDAIDPKSIRR
jgi:peptide/nickel transport system permease protein